MSRLVTSLKDSRPVRFAAKQKPHRPGIAPALGLRAGRRPSPFGADRPYQCKPWEFFAMNQALFRLAGVFCLVGVGTFCFQHFACGTRQMEEQSPHLLPAAIGEYVDGVLVSSDLQTQVEDTHRRLQAKHAIVTGLLARRLTLREAAARFGDLDAEVPGIRDRVIQRHPGVAYKVALCRDVIERARLELRVRAPKQMETILARLEEELKSIQELEDDFCLP
jgi:hypothetical protein